MTEEEQNELLALLANRLLTQLTLLQIIEFSKEGSIAMAHQQIADMTDEEKEKNLEMLRKDQKRMQQAMHPPAQPSEN